MEMIHLGEMISEDASGPLVIAALATTDTREESEKGMEAIGHISRLAYETLSPESVLNPASA